jgi:hypothetical protein
VYLPNVKQEVNISCKLIYFRFVEYVPLDFCFFFVFKFSVQYQKRLAEVLCRGTGVHVFLLLSISSLYSK